MDEAHRIAYLKHMGYEQYFSRYVLPRGKPSVIPAMIESVIDPEGQKESFVKTQHAGPTHVVAASSDIVRRPTAIAARESSSGPPTQEGSELVRAVKAKAENKQARNEELRFSVQFFFVNSRLAVINETPHDAGAGESQQSKSLLTNLMFALGMRQEELANLTADRFNWPIAAGIGTSGDPRHAAKLALNGFIFQRHEQNEFQNLLLLTAQLADLLTDQTEGPEMGDQLISNAQFKLTVTHSLHAMLAHSDLKRDAWQHLADLRERLKQV